MAYHAGAGQHEQGDLRRGVEPETEQHAHGVHVPGLANRDHHPPQDSVHETAMLQQVLERLLVVRFAAHSSEDLHDADEDEQVDDAEHDEEGA